MHRAKFLNVDLDVYHSRPLKRLAEAMEALGASTLHCDRIGPAKYRASFESGCSHRSVDAAIRDLVKVVQSLPPRPRTLFDTCRVRDFNVGIEAGDSPFPAEFHITPRTLKLAAALDARISFTVYRHSKEHSGGE